MGKKKQRHIQSPFPAGIVNDKSQVLDVKKALDAYVNPAANLGAGANNLVETAGYIMQRMSWNYWTLNILFRNNWIAKAIIEKPANEMMKNEFVLQSEMDPEKLTKVMKTWERTKTQKRFLECLKWARLYGGCLFIPMIEGQDDLSKPLDLDSIQVDSYKGGFNIDRWSGVSPSLELVQDISDPEFGQPEFYLVTARDSNKTVKIHHSRVIKMIGRELPYWESVAEMYWGASELEHVYTELKKRDDTSANISFLIFLANIRVYKMESLGQAITLGDQKSLERVYKTMQEMNSLMCNTGTFAIDKEDDFSTQQYTFTGINDVYESFMLDISGAAEIPVDKLFGRSPSGFNNGEETLQNYYDTIEEKRETYVRDPLEKLMKIIMMSTLGEVPDDLEIKFNPIRRPTDMEKADLGSKNTEVILAAYSANLFGKATALKELRQLTPATGLWSNISDGMIEEAEKEDEQKKKDEELEKEELLRAAEGGDNAENQEQTENEEGNQNGGRKDVVPPGRGLEKRKEENHANIR